MCKYCSELREEVWAALNMIRETIESLGPVGVLNSSEYVACTSSGKGHIIDEAEELVQGIIKMG